MIGGRLMVDARVDVRSSVHGEACSHTQVAVAVAMIGYPRTRCEECTDSGRWKRMSSPHLILFVITALAPVMQLLVASLVASRHARVRRVSRPQALNHGTVASKSHTSHASVRFPVGVQLSFRSGSSIFFTFSRTYCFVII